MSESETPHSRGHILGLNWPCDTHQQFEYSPCNVWCEPAGLGAHVQTETLQHALHLSFTASHPGVAAVVAGQLARGVAGAALLAKVRQQLLAPAAGVHGVAAGKLQCHDQL